MGIVGILLAAGRGVRFGGAKLLAPIAADSHGVPAGTAVGVAALLHIRAVLPEVVAVVRPGDTVLANALEQAGARIVTYARARAGEGMGASLACGVAAAPDADGWLVALADMPWIAPASIAVVAAALRGGASIAAPTYRGERGHPVGFARDYRSDLLALSGDEGARSVLAGQREAIRCVPVDDSCVVRDVDTPDDLAAQAGS